MAHCHHCGTEITPPLQRSSRCPSCGRDLKICLHCRFYAPGMSKDCAEPSAEPVKEKDQANFCGYFEMNPQSGKKESGSKAEEAVNKARDAFDALFS